MNASQVIADLKSLPPEGRLEVYGWLQQDVLRDLWRHADAVMHDAPRLAEEDILALPRARSPRR